MSDHPRSLPDRPALRYLKIEAKRRLHAGEFATLHDAQLAVAREHGQPSWAALKHLVESLTAPEPRASAQVRWIASRFAAAGTAGWVAPADGELRGHFHERFLDALPPARLLPRLTALAPRLRGDLVLAEDTATHALVQLDAGQLQAVVEAEPPHRLIGLRAYATGAVDDPRLTAPGTLADGPVPAAALEIARRAFAELGLAGLTLAAADASGTAWTLAHGWAGLEPRAPLTARHRFPVGSVTTLVTAVAVLRLVGEGRVGLDDQTNRYLDTVRLADADVTVRDLLRHTGGVDAPAEPLGDRVLEPVELFGPVIPCGGERGHHRHSDAGYTALGLLIENVTGSPYPRAVTGLVLEPLGMDGSSFPAGAVAGRPESAVTGYAPAADGTLEAVSARMCTMPAAAGLWTTAADLARFGRRWHALLSPDLARQAVTPQAELPGGGHSGLGWQLDRTGDVAGLADSLPGAAASLVVRRRDQRVHVALTNRNVPVEPVNGRVLRTLG